MSLLMTHCPFCWGFILSEVVREGTVSTGTVLTIYRRTGLGTIRRSCHRVAIQAGGAEYLAYLYLDDLNQATIKAIWLMIHEGVGTSIVPDD